MATIIPSQHCLQCDELLDGTSCVGGGDRSPSPGDVTICITCGHIMAFNDDLTFRELNDDDMLKVAGDKRVLAVQLARSMVAADKLRKKKRGKP